MAAYILKSYFLPIIVIVSHVNVNPNRQLILVGCSTAPALKPPYHECTPLNASRTAAFTCFVCLIYQFLAKSSSAKKKKKERKQKWNRTLCEKLASSSLVRIEWLFFLWFRTNFTVEMFSLNLNKLIEYTY